MWDAGVAAKWFSAVDSLPEWYPGKLAYPARVYFLLCLFNGFRRTECAVLQWEHVNLMDGHLLLKETKNGKAHELPLTSYTQTLLEEWQAMVGSINGYVFRSTDQSKPLGNVRRIINAISEKSGVAWQMHDLRRTFATTAVQCGVDHYTLKRLMNHKSGSADVTEGYIITDIEALREPMQKITDKLLALASATLPTTKTATAEAIPE